MSKTGSVARWDEDRGFGFITQSGGQSDIFVHRSSLIGTNTLSVGARVTYEAIFDDRKQKFQTLTCSLMPGEVTQPQFISQQPFGMGPGNQTGSPNTSGSEGGSFSTQQPQFLPIPFQNGPNQNGQFQLFPPSPTLVDLPSPTMHFLMQPSPMNNMQFQQPGQQQMYPQGNMQVHF